MLYPLYGWGTGDSLFGAELSIDRDEAVASTGDVPALVPRTALARPIHIGSQMDHCQADCVERGQKDPGVLFGRT